MKGRYREAGRVWEEASCRELIAAFNIAFQRPDETVETRIILLKFLKDRHAKAAAPVFIRSLNDPSEEVRLEAVDALGRSGAPEAGEILMERFVFADESWAMQSTLSVAFGRLDYTPAIPLLVASLSDPLVRINTVWALRRLNAKEAVPAIEQAIADETDAAHRQIMTAWLDDIKAEGKPKSSDFPVVGMPRNSSGRRQRLFLMRDVSHFTTAANSSV
jgi:HEAT repeat protein